MGRTLFGKSTAILVGLFAVVALLSILLTFQANRAYLREANQRLNRHLAAYLVSRQLFLEGGRANEPALRETFEDLMKVNPSIELYLLDASGRIVTYSAPPGKVRRVRIDLGPVRKILERESPLPVLGDDPRDPARRKIFSASPIPASGAPEGYLYVILEGEGSETVATMLRQSYFLPLSIALTLCVVLVALGSGLVLFRRLTDRLRTLHRAMEDYRGGGFRQPPPLWELPPPSRGDEIDRLGAVFREMAARITGQVERIREADRQRRELIGNVSHDLRTPLTSLHGYLETVLLKGEELSPDQRKEHLETALKHSERLRNLVAELFELARLDSGEVELRPEPFHPGEIVQDILQGFRLQAERKGVRLHTDPGEDLPPVGGDLGLIERAVQNLLDNAIRYTGRNGNVTVRLSRGDSHVRIGISDDGPGILPEEIPLLFERGYRAAPESAAGEEERAGLGLAITKRIVELHGGTLVVESEPGRGSTFSFRLPVWTSRGNPTG